MTLRETIFFLCFPNNPVARSWFIFLCNLLWEKHFLIFLKDIPSSYLTFKALQREWHLQLLNGCCVQGTNSSLSILPWVGHGGMERSMKPHSALSCSYWIWVKGLGWPWRSPGKFNLHHAVLTKCWETSGLLFTWSVYALPCASGFGACICASLFISSKHLCCSSA